MSVVVDGRVRMSEADLLEAVLGLARAQGWRSCHIRPALTRKGPRTAVQGDGKGFPDLILVRGTRMLAIELKATRGWPPPEQTAWLTALNGVPGITAQIWQPHDWEAGHIQRALARE